MTSNLSRGFTYLQEVFQDEQFYVALRHVGGSFIPLIVCEILGYETIGLEMMLGGFIVSGVDIAGTFRSKTKALLIITGFNISITFLLLLTEGALALILPMLFIFIFGLAYISPFSLRYTMMAVMGYLAIILAVSMVGRFQSIEGILNHCFLLLCGSVWYTTFALFLQVSIHLLEGRFDETDYRLARKQAYVEMANVVSSYYRLRDDPESKQMNAEFSYDLALLTYMLLSATTSLGIFLQRYPDRNFERSEFHTLIDAIFSNLDFVLRQLKPLAALKKTNSTVFKAREVENASEALSHRLYELKRQMGQSDENANGESVAYLKYVHLDYLRRQLSWMLDLSRSLAEHAARPD